MSDATGTASNEPNAEMGEERALLLNGLQRVQQSLLWKIEGLSDTELRRPMTMTGTNLIGIVKHLTGITYGYLCSAFGREREILGWEFDEELMYSLDMWATPDESTQEIIAAYRRACEASAGTIIELDLNAKGWSHSGDSVTLRQMALVVLQDTTRHTGHADVVREMIDGQVGNDADDGMVYRDEEMLRMYRARITGEIDRDTWIAYNRSHPGYDPSTWENYQRRVKELWYAKRRP